jgi:macrolide-specific efflux system membrane fusion protein
LPTFTVQRGEVIYTLDFQAQAAPLDAQPLSFTVAGSIGKFFVQAGEVITAGQVLAALNTSKAEQELASIQDDLDLYEAANARVLRKAELGVQIAQLTLDLYTQQGRSETEIQIAQLQLELAQIAYDEIVLNPELLSRRERAIELTETISNSQLIAPADSRVGQIFGAAGKSVAAGAPILTYGDPDAMEWTAQLDMTVIEQLRVGQEVNIAPVNSSLPPVRGMIAALPTPFGEASDGLVHLRLAKGVIATEAGFTLGGQATITVEIARKPNALWLPPEAIHRVADRTWVILQEGDTRRRIDITLGVVTAGRVEILEGIAEGQVVVGP